MEPLPSSAKTGASSQTNGEPPEQPYDSVNAPLIMHLKRTENRTTPASSRRTRYHVINHQEAGLFDSMTIATLWALKNVNDWDWRIEPVSSGTVM
jgi:hypothetical protein